MPGITGVYLKRDNNLNLSQLNRRMVNVLIHEDWYKVDTIVDKKYSLNRVSLGILNPQSQPIFNRDRTLCIMMEGEIYAYEDIKERLIKKGYKFRVGSDVEFVLYLYEEYQDNFDEYLKRINGIFHFAIYDYKKNILIICNDRYGFRTLYWCDRGDYLLFSPEIKGILKDDSLKKEVNLETVSNFFSFQHPLGNHTFLNNIETLPPASILICSERDFRIEKYLDFKEIEKTKVANQEEIVDELGKLLLQAVERRMKGPGRRGLSLSGGLDSRMIASAIPKDYYPIQAVTYGNKDCVDYKTAKRVADVLGIEHHLVEIDGEGWFANLEKVAYLTDYHANVVHLHTMEVIGVMRQLYDIFLDGSLGEVFKGDYYFIEAGIESNNIGEYVEAVFTKMNLGQISPEQETHFYSGKAKQLRGLSRASLRKNIIENINKPEDSDYFFINSRGRRFFNAGLDLQQTKLEVLRPFCDNEFLDLVVSLPNKLRDNQYISGKMALKFFPETFKDIPWEHTGFTIGTLKKIIEYHWDWVRIRSKVNRSARRFGFTIFKEKSKYVDYNNWMRNVPELRKYIYDTLISERSKQRNYFNPVFMKDILDSHMSGKSDNSNIIGLLLTFELFNRMFID